MSETLAPIALLTPLSEERDALEVALSSLGHKSARRSIGRLDCIHFADLSLVVALGGHGKTQFGVHTQHVLDHASFRLVICVGAAGSLHQDVGVGDLVAATVTVEHDYTLRFVTRPLPRFEADGATLDGLRRVARLAEQPFKLHFGPVASGDEDVVDTLRAKELAQKTNALCVAWEGAGAGRACQFSRVPYLELRAVTDSADKSAPQDFDDNLPRCMGNVAKLLNDWLSDTGRSAFSFPKRSH